MRYLPARLAMVVFVGLILRAAFGQPPATNTALRYPLPGSGPALPAAGQAPLATPVAAEAAVPSRAVLFEPGQIVARVGDKTILYGDVAPTVNLIMEPVLAKAKSSAERDSIEAQREALTKIEIQKAVQNKMLLIEFERGMPSEMRSDVKKRAEAEGKLRKSVREGFDRGLNDARKKAAQAKPDDLEQLLQQDPTMMRLALLMKDRDLQSPGELDIALRQFGTALDQQVKSYGEHLMGMEAVRNKLGLNRKKPPEVTHQEMLDFYQEHSADYQIPAKARFEILTAKLSRFNGDRLATQNHVAMMGNEVLFGGTPFPAVAKKHSQEPNAADGGYYDWVAPGSLASKPIDRAVFSLEVDKLSQIIDDDQGSHIIRVKERQPAGQVSFEEEQPEIRKKIEAQKRAAQQQKYFSELRARTTIWTIYDLPGEAPSNENRAASQ